MPRAPLPLRRPGAPARAADRGRGGPARARAGPWTMVDRRDLPPGTGPLRARPRGRPRADQALLGLAWPLGRRRGDGGAARALRRVGRSRERLPPRRVPPWSGAGTAPRCGLDSPLMAVERRHVAILGVGTIGESLLRGLLSGGWREPAELVATVRSDERAADLAERYGVRATVSNAEAVADAELVVIAVKPQDFDALLGEIGGVLSPEQTVLSVAAAIPTAAIEQRVSAGVPVVRAMPNRPATVHEGIAGVCAGAHARDEHLTLAEEALSHLGAVVRVPERYMDAVTAVSGSGPAYFALLAEAMIEAGILLGLSREISTQLVVQTMLGTAKLLRDEHIHPVELREAVTSPGGTTIRAIRELERAGVRAAFLNAIQAAMERSRELAAGEP